MSDSVQPHRWQPTRLSRPWDSPGKNTGVGCHFPLQCRKGKSGREFAQSCPTLIDPMDCSLPGSSVRGIFQARVLEWGAIACLNPTKQYKSYKALKFQSVVGMVARVLQKFLPGTSLMVQWLRLCALNVGGLGSIPGQATRSHMLQLTVRTLQLKTLYATAKTWGATAETWHSQKQNKIPNFQD